MPRVFFSYSQDSDDHCARVLALAQQLRADGVDVILDRFVGDPEQGWPRWMADELAAADFVLVVVSRGYCDKVEGRVPVGTGRGVKWESHLSAQMLYDADTRNTKFVPVVLDGIDDDAVPTVLRAWTRYFLPRDHETLLRRLFAKPAVVPAPLGPAKKFD